MLPVIQNEKNNPWKHVEVDPARLKDNRFVHPEKKPTPPEEPCENHHEFEKVKPPVEYIPKFKKAKGKSLDALITKGRSIDDMTADFIKHTSISPKSLNKDSKNYKYLAGVIGAIGTIIGTYLNFYIRNDSKTYLDPSLEK